MDNFKYSVIIPVYKSSKSLETIAKQFSELEAETGYKFELIFVNDSPFYLETNKTLKILEKSYENVRAIFLRKNQGQHKALLVGISKATGDFLITMDDDLQHPVQEVPKLIKGIQNNKDIEAIFAVPNYKEKKHSLCRNAGSFLLTKVDTVFLKKPQGLVKSSFRIMTRDLAEVIVKNYNSTPAVSSLIISATGNIKNIKVKHNSREYGVSNYSTSKLISLTLNNIIQFSSLPLKLVGLVGLCGFILSILFILIMFARKIFIGIDYPGYTSTVTLISFFGGLNLFAVGLIGEYLIRIIKEQKKEDLESLIKN